MLVIFVLSRIILSKIEKGAEEKMFLISDKRKSIKIFYPSSITGRLKVYKSIEEISSSVSDTTYIYEFTRMHSVYAIDNKYYSNNPIVGQLYGMYKRHYYGFEFIKL